MVYWSVARPSRTLGDVLVLDGYVDGDDAAVAQIVEAGTQLMSASEGAQPLIWATLGCANTLVDGFADPSTDRDALTTEIRRNIAKEQERQRTAGVTPRVRHRPPATTTVRDQWTRIADWIDSHVPGMSITGASRDDIDAAIKATGQVWPDDLIELFTHINGIPDEPWMALLPRHVFLTLDQLVEERAMMIRIWEEGAVVYELDPDPVALYAGEEAWTFIPGFVPFAGLDSNYLCVDTRPGPLFGCVTGFDKSGADEMGPLWASITDMLEELADGLTTERDFDEGWQPVIADDTVEWDWDRSRTIRQIVLRECQ